MDSTDNTDKPDIQFQSKWKRLRRNFTKTNLLAGMIAHVILTAFLLVIVLLIWLRATPNEAMTNDSEQRALELLRGLKVNLHTRDAAETMQAIFPEGACFTWSLYGWGWANIARHGKSPHVHDEATTEIRAALAGQLSPASTDPFDDTQVRNGMLWLGQRNYLLATSFQTTSVATALGPELESEFHRNSAELYGAFMASPTLHLDSYEGMCWPADHTAGLVSLVLHDKLYETNYTPAYDAWKQWTLNHLDPLTSMPMGHLVQKTGHQLEPARGCANSVMISMLMEIDPHWARALYAQYIKEFGLQRLGFRMFREWPASSSIQRIDIDSGPIIWGAGITATGVAIGTARAVGDQEAARDIADLAIKLGFPNTWEDAVGNAATWHFGGWLPVGDAFQAWGWSLAPGSNVQGIERHWSPGSRTTFHAAALGLVILLLGQSIFALWRFRRQWKIEVSGLQST